MDLELESTRDLHLVSTSQLHFLAYPNALDTDAPPANWLPTQSAEIADAFVLTSPTAQQNLVTVLTRLKRFYAPIVSMCGEGLPWFDHVIDYKKESSRPAFTTAAEIVLRLSEIPQCIIESENVEDVLLARIYSRGGKLAATYDPKSRPSVCYPGAGILTGVAAIANRLAERGFLTRKFFDRVHVCSKGGCGSSRLNVREECANCRSPDIVEEPIIHHYKCGHAGRQSLFRTPTRFLCPKCGEALRHIGLDYDKPGQMLFCNGCGSQNDAGAVGFVCMDCGTHTDTELTPTRDWYSYELTSLGSQLVLNGRTAERVGLPETFRVLLRQSMLLEAEFNARYSVLRVAFSREAHLRREGGALLWARLKGLALDAIRSALHDPDVVTEYDGGFLLLLILGNGRNAQRTSEEIKIRIYQVLRHDPGVVVEVVQKQEQLAWLNNAAAEAA
jgi:hypothetical protein